MAIESAVMFRRAARTACLILFVGLLACRAALAQLPIKPPAPVTVGSIIPFSHGGTGVWNQIYSMKVSPNGHIVFLDSAASVIYQIAPGQTEPSIVVGPAPTNGSSNCSDLEPAGTYWNAAIAFDQWNNMYVTDRYGSAVQFCRVPYNSSAGTWSFSNADNWTGPTYKNGTSSAPIPPQDLQVGDDGTFYVTTSDTQSIFSFTVNEAGTVGTVTALATGLEDMVSNIAVDHAGNLFFLENVYDSPTNRVTGIREIPKGSPTIVGDSTGSAESKLTRIDPASAGFNGSKGISFDTQGNLYFTSENNSGFGGQVDGIFMIPNEGTPTSPNLVWADTTMISPVPGGFPVLVDPRGLLFIATGGSGNWAPPGSIAPTCDTTSTKTVAATCLESTIVLWKPGTLNLGETPAGTAATAQPLFYMFTKPTTPSKFALAGSGATSFVRSPNPIADPNATTPNPPCTDGTAYPGFSGVETNPSQYSWCAYWVALNPTAAGNVGAEVQALNATGGIISGGNGYLTGIGQAPAVSVISSAAIQPLATGLSAPQQVTADAAGNTYVADSGLKAIEKYPAGATSAAVGTQIQATGLKAPTGVAVDRAGDLYIADSGDVIEIPFINGALATAQQTTIATGLGNELNLAADSAGNIYVADKSNADVVELPNPQTALLLDGLPMEKIGAGAGFTGPTAVATDNAGNVWVADGSNLWEISQPYGVATEVLAGGLQAPVTGLAVDPSGSVFVAGASGLVWIPYNPTTGALDINGVAQVASGLGAGGTALPIGVALDASENAYATYGSGATAGLAQLGIAGSLDFSTFGEVNPNVPLEADAQIYNVGNMNLTVQDDPTNDVITGAAASDYSVGTATENSPSCGPTVNVAPGGSCFLGLTVLAPTAGQANASIAVASNALNDGTALNIAIGANVIQDPRPATTVAMVLTPASGVVYPGSISIQVNVSAGAAYGTPSGSVILSVSSTNGSLPKQTQTLDANGSATFTFSNLLGGTYTVNALYGGSGTGGAAQNTCSPATTTCFAGNADKTTFVVAPAQPTFVVGQPGNSGCLTETTAAGNPCTPNADNLTVWAGNTYLAAGQSVLITTTVTSPVGTPSGTVTFMQNGKVADPTQGVNGAISLNATTINGNVVQTAVFSTQNLAEGVYHLTAVYSGDVNYATQNVSVPAFEVIQPSVQITSSGTVSVTPGTPATATLTLEPLVGFSGNVHLECNSAGAPVPLAPTTPPTVLPAYTECTFAYPDTVNGIVPVGVSGTTASTIVVTISTNVPVNGGATTSSIARQSPWELAGLFGLGLLGVIAGRKKLYRHMAVMCVAIMISGLLMGVTACTNAGYSTPPPAPKVTTPSGTYNVQIITYNQNSLVQSSLTTPMFTLPLNVQ